MKNCIIITIRLFFKKKDAGTKPNIITKMLPELWQLVSLEGSSLEYWVCTINHPLIGKYIINRKSLSKESSHNLEIMLFTKKWNCLPLVYKNSSLLFTIDYMIVLCGV